MKTLIIYDSLYGNTAKIAKIVNGVIGNGSRVLPVSSVSASDLAGVELLIVGSPTHGGKPTTAIQKFISGIDPARLRHLRFAAFDTRVDAKFAKYFGFAADRIAEAFENNHVQLAAEPAGFVVMGKEGPLKNGETDRAAVWAKKITAGVTVPA